jgi:gliding motility-associated-like protein
VDIAVPISQNLINSSSIPQRVVYTITPYALDAVNNLACSGTPIDVEIWVEPTIVITANNDTICNEGTTNISLNTSNTSTNGIVYTYTSMADNPADIIGNGSDASGIDIATPINETLNNLSPDSQRVVYTITPYTLDASGNMTCMDTSINVDIWVEPTVTITAENDTICHATSTNINVLSSNTTTKGIHFTWTATADNPGAVNGYNNNSTGIDIANPITQTINNTSDTAQRIVYIITPHTLNTLGELECSGVNDTIDIWVEPAIQITALSDTICNNTDANIKVNTSYGTTNGIHYTWTATPENPADISGTMDGPANGQYIELPIIQTLDNLSNDKQLVTYDITPHALDINGNLHCAGTSIEVEIWTEPTVQLSADDDTICSLNSTNITLSTLNTTTNGISYIWSTTSSDTSALNGYQDDTTGVDIGVPIVQTIENPTDNAEYIDYKITPYTRNYFNNLTCKGDSTIVRITIDPPATIQASIAGDTICNTGQLDFSWTSPTVASNGIDVNIEAIAENPDSVSGYSSYSSLLISHNVSETLDNHSNSVQRITYILTPYILDVFGIQKCAGINDTVVVELLPTMIPKLYTDTYIGGHSVRCFGDTANIMLNVTGGLMALGENQDNCTYSWSDGTTTRNNLGVSFDDDEQTYMVTITDRNNCTADAETELTQPKEIVANRTYKDITCKGYGDGWIEISPGFGTEPYSVSWFYDEDSTAFDNITTQLIDSLEEGNYTYTILDINNCELTEKQFIDDPDGITIDTVEFHQPYCNDSYDGIIEIEISGGTGNYDFEWSDGHKNEYLREQLFYGYYELTITDDENCPYYTAFNLPYLEKECLRDLYNVITPNGDGVNDKWSIMGIDIKNTNEIIHLNDLYPNASVKIFDRWGRLVFSAKGGYNEKWDGRGQNGRLLPAASYFFVIDKNNGDDPITGAVSIIYSDKKPK